MKEDICTFENSDDLSLAATQIFVGTASLAIQARGRFLAAISGGSTPGKLFSLLAGEPYRAQVGWKNTFIFWADERIVPPDDEDSNYRQAVDALLSRVPLPDENILRIKGELEPAEASKEYARTLKRFASPPLDWPRFDLALLGMGADGHTASLFPGSPVEASTPTLTVTADYQGRPAQRVTLTPQVFNAARHVVFLVSGESKSATLARVLNGEKHPEKLPAQRIRPREGTLTWLVDQAAGSKL